MDDAGPLRLRFDAFELDEANARLTHEGSAVQLPPKAFSVLCVLARQPGMLLTKDALLDAAWGHRHVSESVLKSTISQLRIALADDAKQPRYIETASRRGYRFIATSSSPQPQATNPIAFPTPDPSIIGRGDALATLHDGWHQAAQGKRQICWVVGEAGVGKTTLIETFINSLGEVITSHGQCVEEYGAGEPYLPVLEALAELCRKDATLPPLMRAVAPTWLLQLPWLTSETERATLQREVAGGNQDRMLRELAELLDRYTQKQPLLLITEDLHWSDHATVRLIDHVARRRGPARLMWLASFRLADVIAADHPLKGLRHELRLHKLCSEITLDPFSEQELADYVGSRFPQAAIPEPFVRSLHAHTDGLPLFVVNVIDDLVEQGAIDPEYIAANTTAARWKVPENLAGVMEKQIARLPAECIAVLEVASVCGMEFRPETVAAALGQDIKSVGESCNQLVRQQYWIRHLDVSHLADGSLDARYAFRHALYRHVFYRRIGALARAQLHRSAAAAMERGREKNITVTAAELAAQYEAGQDWMAALRHYGDAADNALKHFAPVEALALSAHGLSLLPHLPTGLPAHSPDNPERDSARDSAHLSLELTLVMRQAIAASQRYGMVADETLAAYARAEALCDKLPETPALGWVLAGLSQARYAEGNFDAMLALGTRIHDLATRHNDAGLIISACTGLGIAHAARGEHETGQRWLRQGLAVVDQLGNQLPVTRFFIHPVALMGGHLAMHLVPTGHVDEARRAADATLARARAIGHPMAIGLSLRCYCFVEARLGEPQRVADMAQELAGIAATYGIPQAKANSLVLKGWAQAQLGDPEQGLPDIREGHALFKQLAMSAGNAQIAIFAIVTLILLERWTEAQMELDAALAIAQHIGERFYLPDLLLLQARIALGQGETTTAKKAMQDSLKEARNQQALWYELSTLVALCELKGATQKDRAALKEVDGRVVEGRNAGLVSRAKALIT